MAWKQNPQTGESYEVPDPTPGAGTESGYQNPNAGGKQPKVPKFNGGNWKPPPPLQLPPKVAPQGPIFPQGPAQPNANGYTPTTAPFGMDMSAPGVNEQHWNQNQGMWFDMPGTDWVDQQLPQFSTPWDGEMRNTEMLSTMGNPGAGQQYWNGVQGAGNSQVDSMVKAGYHGPNNSQVAFDMTKANLPGSLQPQFDAYYDRMKQKSMSDVNSQSAARGSYGSNSALNNSIGAGIDVEAQRAAAATKFSLDDSANQRNWFDSLGTIGRNADLSGTDAFGRNIDASKFGLDKTKTLGDLAFKSEQMDFDKQSKLSEIAFDIDEHKQDRLDSGISSAFRSDEQRRAGLEGSTRASESAQNSREGRINTLSNAITSFSRDTQDFFSENYDKLLGADGQINLQQLETAIAQAADQRGWDQQTQERIFRDASKIAEIVNGTKTADAAKAAPAAPKV